MNRSQTNSSEALLLNLKLRRYSAVVDAAISNKALYEGVMKPMARRTLINTVGRCMLTVSRPRLNAPMVSALETKMS